MKKILITGANGFIGRNLKEQFINKYTILAPTRENLNLLDEESVTDFFKKNKVDVVIHSATENATVNSKGDISKVLNNNLRMYFNLAKNNDLYEKMIYFGSGAEFSRDHYIPKMKEEYFGEFIPKDDYGFSKYIMTKHALQTKNIYNLRLFGVFGKYEDWEIRFISNTICKVIYDLPIFIKQNVYFDYLYIDDLCRIVDWFINNNPKQQVYNVCTSRVYSLKDLAYKIIELANKDIDIYFVKEGEGKEYSGNNSKLIEDMGGFEFSSISESIKKLYDWYVENKGLIDKEKLYYLK